MAIKYLKERNLIMITNKDIRVENGSLILNGDPYPLDGQSPEAIMEIVEDNSDTTPTENSTAPITSGGIYNTIGDLTQTGVTGATVAAQVETLNNNDIYKAGDTIVNENVVVAGVAYNVNDCYFTLPLNKPVNASNVTITDLTCTLFYGTNQKEVVGSGATYTGVVKNCSILVKVTKGNNFVENGRYILDFYGTFTFS